MDLSRLSTLKQAAVVSVIGMLVVSTVGLVAQPAALGQPSQFQQNGNGSQANTTTTETTETQAENETEMGERSAEDILQAAQDSYQDIEDFNATLVSSSTISNGSGNVQTTNTTAKLSVKQPDKVRLETLEPEIRAGSIVVSNGTATVIYDAANNTVSSFNLSDFGGMGAANQTGYLSGIEQSLSQANVSYEGTATVDGQDTYVLSATPNASVGNLTSNQTYYLSQESYIPVKTVTEGSFSLGNETTTTTSTTLLRDLQVNVGLSDSVFDFEAPEDANRTGGPASNISTYDSVATAQENTDIAVCEPSETPEGYSFANATVTTIDDNSSVILRYTNGSADPFNGSMSVSISTAQSTQQANGSTLGENVSVNGQSGTYIGSSGQGLLTFANGDLQYTVTGPFSQDELVSIGESINCTTDGSGADDAEDEAASEGADFGQNDEDDDGDGHVDEDDEDPNDSPSNDNDDGDGAIDEDDEPDDGDDGSDDFNGDAEDDDDGDGHYDEDDEDDGGNSDDEDNDNDGAVDEDDEPDNDD